MNKKLYLILLAIAAFAAAFVQKAVFSPMIMESMIAQAAGAALVTWVLSALPLTLKNQRWTIPVSMFVFVVVVAANFYSAVHFDVPHP
jgi:uncharacterized membrane protein (DUF485 family)